MNLGKFKLENIKLKHILGIIISQFEGYELISRYSKIEENWELVGYVCSLCSTRYDLPRPDHCTNSECPSTQARILIQNTL